MDKSKLNYWIDVGLIISFLIAAVTGVLKFPGLLPSLGISYSSLPMRQITRAHDWWGIVMTVLVLVHLFLHWKWLVVMTKSLFKKKVE